MVEKGLGVPKSGSQHSAPTPQKKASASKMWLGLDKLHSAGNGEGLEWKTITFGKCGNVGGFWSPGKS